MQKHLRYSLTILYSATTPSRTSDEDRKLIEFMYTFSFVEFEIIRNKILNLRSADEDGIAVKMIKYAET